MALFCYLLIVRRLIGSLAAFTLICLYYFSPQAFKEIFWKLVVSAGWTVVVMLLALFVLILLCVAMWGLFSV